MNTSYLDKEIRAYELVNRKQVDSKHLYSGEYDNRPVYVSYNTIIAEKVEGEWNFTVNKYSVTTSRQTNYLKRSLKY